MAKKVVLTLTEREVNEISYHLACSNVSHSDLESRNSAWHKMHLAQMKMHGKRCKCAFCNKMRENNPELA